MDKEFVPYEQSLQLKELGFDEPCFGFYLKQTLRLDGKIEYCSSQEKNKYVYEGECLSPTFSQAFRWFREKHGLYHHIVPEFYTKGINFNWQILWYLPKEEWTKHIISDGTGLYGDNGEYPTQEEAELACLIKLIEILKNEKLKN